MKNFTKRILSFLLLCFLLACSSSNDDPPIAPNNPDTPEKCTDPKATNTGEDLPCKYPEPTPPPPQFEFIARTPNPWKNNPYKLNVIYFVPNDLDTLTNYKSRISNTLLYIQDVFAKQMQRTGHGDISFAMNMSTDTEVNIITLRSNNNKDYFPINDTGIDRITDEVNQYFTANQNDKLSEHTIVITPVADESINDPQFAESGKIAVALDFPDMSIDKFKEDDQNVKNITSARIGGLAHYIGKILNVPNNKELKRENFLGKSLMSEINKTLGISDTYLTKASTEILFASQPFAIEPRSDWYTDVSSTIKILNVEFLDVAVDKRIVLTGLHSSDIPVSGIVAFHDPNGEANSNSIGFVANIDDNGIFSVESHLGDFHTLSGNYQLRIVIYYKNGTNNTFTYNYSFSDGKPSVDMINTQMIDTSSWIALYASSENPSSTKERVIDGDVGTYWHTRWSNGYDDFPFELIIDMTTQTDINGFAFYTRDQTHGTINEFEILKSDDNNTWTSIGTFNLKKQSAWQYLVLPDQHSMRYVKILVNSSHRTQEEIAGGDTYTHLSEFAAFN